MAETQVPGTSAIETAADEQDELVVTGERGFTIGPPQAVTDPQQLPAVTPEQEADFVSRANAGIKHPDSAAADAVADVQGDDVEAAEAAQPLGVFAGVDNEEDEDLPGDDELDALVAEVDEDDVDDVGFDDDDVEEPLEIDLTDADEPSGRGES